MKKYRKFKKGTVVISGLTVVLVTGPGKLEDYPTFSGTVILDTSEENKWPLGEYSETWNREAFTKIEYNISKTIAKEIISFLKQK